MPESSYVSGPSERPLLGRTIGAQLDLTRLGDPDAEAIVARHQGVRLTYRELHAEVERAARALLALGVAKGDRVGIWSPNRVEWAIAQYATAKVGAILVNVNPAYRRHELRHAMTAAGVSVLVAARGFHAADYVAMLEDERPELPSLRTIVLLGEGDLPGGRSSWDAFVAIGVGDRDAGAPRPRSDAGPRRPDQHPVHLGHDRRAEGRHPHASQHAEQRGVGGGAAALRGRGSRLRAGALLPLLRDGAGQPRVPRPRGDRGAARGVVRCRRVPRRDRGRAVHERLRRPHDVHRDARGIRRSTATTSRACGPA